MVNPQPHAPGDYSSDQCLGLIPAELPARSLALNSVLPAALYPFPTKPFATLQVTRPGVAGDVQVGVEQYGAPAGVPVVMVHGGLFVVFKPEALGFLNPERLRVISVHQRGVGSSSPIHDLRDLSTHALAEDLEAVRVALKIDSWHVFGHSFGGTVALLYAAKHYANCRSLTCLGSFLPGEENTRAFLAKERRRFPAVWDSRRAAFPGTPDDELPARFADAILGSSLVVDVHQVSAERARLVRAYLGKGPEDPISEQTLRNVFLTQWYRAQNYMLEGDWLNAVVEKLVAAPVCLAHSVEDEIVDPASTLDLLRRLPRAALSLVVGPHFFGTEIAQKSLRRVCDRLPWD